MPAPTNTSKATATEITTFPYSIVEDANDGGVTKDLWFTATPTASGLYSAWALGALGGPYTPETHVVLADDTPAVLGNPNLPAQYYLTAGTPYWWQCHNINGNHSPAVLTFTVERLTTLGIRSGDLFIPDDANDGGNGFPGIMISGTDGTVTHVISPFPNGESGDVVLTGQMLVQDKTTTSMRLYSPQFVSNASILYTLFSGETPVAHTGANDGFFFAMKTAVNTVTLKQINLAGTVIDTQTLGSTTGVTGIAPNHTDTVLYLAGKVSASDSSIAQWDLVNHVYLANFVAAVAGYNAPVGLLCLQNGKVVVLYQDNLAPTRLTVKIYSTLGVELASRDLNQGALIADEASRLAYASDDPTSFWAWMHLHDNTYTIFRLNSTDLTDVQAPFTRAAFEEGASNVTPSADPDRFGPSISCPFLELRVSSVTQTFPIRRQRRFLLPSSPDNKTMQIPVIEILMRTGIGLTPGPVGAPVQGQDPQVMFRLSKDGGKTWSPERWVSAGKIGEYTRRVRLLRATGNYRNAVLELTISDPVDVQLLAALAPNGIVEGSS